jgi:hypothetical protein
MQAPAASGVNAPRRAGVASNPVRGHATRRSWSSAAEGSGSRTWNCADVYASNPGAPLNSRCQTTGSRSNWNYGRFVEPPRTFLAGVGETNMSQQLGG